MVFYFIFIAFFAAAPVFGAVAAPVASHAEISLFRAKEADKIAQSKNNLGTKLDVLGALTCLKEKLHKAPRAEMSFIQFSRFVFGMLVGNGYPNGVTTTLRANPAEKVEIEKIVKEASVYVKKYDFKEPNIWSADVNSAEQKEQHAGVLNAWWDGANRNEKLSIQPKNAEANAHDLDVDKQIFEGPYAEVPKVAMDALYKENMINAPLILRFIEYFSKLSDAKKEFILNYLQRNPTKQRADYLMTYIARELNKAIPPNAAVLVAPVPAALPPAPPPVAIAVANPRAAYEALIQGNLSPDQREMLNEFITIALTPGIDEWQTDIIKEFIRNYVQLADSHKRDAYVELGNFIEPGFRQRRPGQREVDAFKALVNNGDKTQIIINLKWWLDDQIANHAFILNAPVAPAAIIAPAVVAPAAIAAPAEDPFIAKLKKDIVIADFTQTLDSAIEKQNIAKAAILLTNFKAIGIETFNAGLITWQEVENISRFATDFSKLSDADKNAICAHLQNLIWNGIHSGAGRYEIEEMVPINGWIGGQWGVVRHEPQIIQATKSENLGNLLLPVTYPPRSAEDLLRSKAELVKDTCNYLRDQIANNSMQLLSEAQIAQEAANAALGFRWHFWKGPTGRAPARKHFNMPTPNPGQALTPRGMHFIEFFMDMVMPKLEELYYANKITANDIAYVLRAAGMGLLGLEEQELYLIQFRAYIDGFILDIDGKIPPVGYVLASLPYYGNPYQKFPDTAADSHPFKEIEVEKQAPNVTPFHSIHAENQLEPYRDRYNIAVDQGNFTEVRKNTLKNDVIEGFKAALDNLSGLIRTGFTSAITLGDEQKLIQFIKSFNTTVCYDGTTDVIAAKAIELGLIGEAVAAQGPVTKEEAEQQFAAALMNPDSKPKLKAIFEEIRADGDNKLDGFIKAARAAAGAQGPDDYPPLHHTYLPAATVVLQDFFGNVEIIREVVGKNAAGNCALTDAQILELIYWSAAAADGVPPADVNIAKLFGY
ncbi:MAG: hypothetical protein WCJ92_07190 [Alphaproteobacteria bacterium]